MGCGINNNSLFGPSNAYIKFQGGDAVAVDGPNIFERLILNNIKFPYKQLLKGRIILKAGQINYLMNHLGLGDNATFVLMTAKYDSKSVIPEDNYVQYSYYNDSYRLYTFAQALLLTGTGTQRIPQLYLNNPSTYSVSIDVMVAAVDDNYNFFPEDIGNGISLYNLEYTSIVTFTVDKTLSILGPDGLTAVLYIDITDISTIERSSKILIIEQTSIGKIYLDFKTEYDALQSLSLINWVMEENGRVITSTSPGPDSFRPVISFTNIVYFGLTGSTYSSPTTQDGDYFNATVSISDYDDNIITKPNLFSGTYSLISSVVDYDNRAITGGLTSSYYRDGIMGVDSTSIIIKDDVDNQIDYIDSVGEYEISFNISDIAGNNLSDVILSLNVI